MRLFGGRDLYALAFAHRPTGRIGHLQAISFSCTVELRSNWYGEAPFSHDRTRRTLVYLLATCRSDFQHTDMLVG